MAALTVRAFVWRNRTALYDQMRHRDPQVVAAEKIKQKRQG